MKANNLPLMPVQPIKLREAQPYVATRSPFFVSHYLQGRWVRTLDMRQCHYVVYFAGSIPMLVYDDKAEIWFVSNENHGKMWLRITNAVWPQSVVAAAVPAFDTLALERIIARGFASLTRKRLGIETKRTYSDWTKDLREYLIKEGHITPWESRKGK